MKSFSKNKTTWLIALLIILAFFVYNSFFKSTPPSFTISDSVKNIGANVVKTYSNLQSVNLNQSLFSSPAYTNLIDFSTTPPSQPAGRSDPFAVLGK